MPPKSDLRKLFEICECCMFEFQSLVGTLKTGYYIGQGNLTVGFQSLVGTLKTLARDRPNAVSNLCFNPS